MGRFRTGSVLLTGEGKDMVPETPPWSNRVGRGMILCSVSFSAHGARGVSRSLLDVAHLLIMEPSGTLSRFWRLVRGVLFPKDENGFRFGCEAIARSYGSEKQLRPRPFLSPAMNHPVHFRGTKRIDRPPYAYAAMRTRGTRSCRWHSIHCRVAPASGAA